MSSLPGGVTLQELEVILALAEEPHVGRTAQRLYLSQPYVSRTLAALERKLGGQVVDRRAHRLTVLGETVVADLRPAYDDLAAALTLARSRADGTKGVHGVHDTTIADLRAAYEERMPGGVLEVREVLPESPYLAVRSGDYDAFLWWRQAPASGLEFGPPVERQQALVAMRADHPLASRSQVTLDNVADHALMLPAYVDEAGSAAIIFPAATPSGRAIPREFVSPGYLAPSAYALSRSDALFLLTDGVARNFDHRTDIVFRPIAGADPYELAPLWPQNRDDDRLLALADAARTVGS